MGSHYFSIRKNSLGVNLAKLTPRRKKSHGQLRDKKSCKQTLRLLSALARNKKVVEQNKNNNNNNRNPQCMDINKLIRLANNQQAMSGYGGSRQNCVPKLYFRWRFRRVECWRRVRKSCRRRKQSYCCDDYAAICNWLVVSNRTANIFIVAKLFYLIIN
jgi:hypothetical protein